MYPTSISEWTVKDFIQCTIYENYSCLGDGEPREIQNRLNDLLAQYYEAKGDEVMIERMRIGTEMTVIEVRRNVLAVLTEAISLQYDHRIADILRKLYPYQYTPETLDNDLEMIRRGELSYDLKYSRLTKRLEDWEKKNTTTAKQTKEQRHAAITNLIFDINHVEGVAYSINTMSVLELAVAEKRLAKYADNLQLQKARNGGH